jgi:hypothetical protein
VVFDGPLHNHAMTGSTNEGSVFLTFPTRLSTGHVVRPSAGSGRWITDDLAHSGQIADQSRRYRSFGRCSN